MNRLNLHGGLAISNIQILLIVLAVVLVVAVMPVWPHTRNMGYGPAGVVALILLIAVLICALL